jgi:hypothetical protein
LSLDEIKFPFDDHSVAKTLEYAKKTLHPETLNHSMRVYCYGTRAEQNVLIYVRLLDLYLTNL